MVSMKIKLAVSVLIMLFSCGRVERSIKERIIVYYVDVQKKEKEIPAVKQEKKKIHVVSSREKTQYKLLFDEVLKEMKEKGILPGDLGVATKDFSFLKRCIKNESYNNFYKRQRRLLKKLIDIRIDQSFVQDKYRRLREAISTVAPQGKNLMKVEAKIISAEQLMQEQKYELANRVINELFDMLGK